MQGFDGMENEPNPQVEQVIADNPDLPVSFIIDLLAAQQEAEQGQVTPYEFG